MSAIRQCTPARWLLLLFLLVLPACGQGNPLGRRAIDGHVSLDGSPLASGHIQFIPQHSGGVSSGALIAQGNYKLDTPRGLPPGKYYVQVFSPQNTPKVTEAAPQTGGPQGAIRLGIETIPAKYNTETTLSIEVAPSAATTFDFELKSK
jgi:hypothetical protein